jgi:carbon storage regulator CsrA
MLVLSRRPSESIVFPELNISLTIVSVRGQVARIGIEAPPSVSIFREEVLLRANHEHFLGNRRKAIPLKKGASTA